MSLILSLSDPRALNAGVAGGKGASLARLIGAGFPVPPGIVVTVDAFRRMIASADAGLDAVDRLRQLLTVMPLPDGLTAELERALAESIATPHAVRSSSVSEDGSDAAFAGQHDSFLNRTGLAAIEAAIRGCLASAVTDRAIAYRRDRGLSMAAIDMAVVVQRQIACRAAGVAFTLDPVTGRQDEILVTANFGLGESVVGGTTEVDCYRFDKASLALRSAAIGDKSAYTVTTGTGTAEIATPSALRRTPSLSEEDARAVADLAKRAEAMHGFPQDIEWGIDEAGVWVLQARPVTTIPPRWTRDEAAERFPNVVTPLAWDFVEDGFHAALAHSLALMGLPPLRGKWFALFDNYVYGNQSAVDAYLSTTPLAIRSVDQLRAALPALLTRFQWVQDLPDRWAQQLDQYLLDIGALAVEPLEHRTLQELWNYVGRVNALGRDYFKSNIAISMGHNGLHRALAAALRLFAGEPAAGTMLDALLGAVETRTSAINRELQDMAALVRADAALSSTLTATRSPAEIRTALVQFPEFGARLARFLSQHGHREVDFDPYHPTWGEAPLLVLDSIKVLAKRGAEKSDGDDRRDRRRRAIETEFAVMAAVPDDMRPFLHELVHLARGYTVLDDLEHYQTARLTPLIRRGLRALGAGLTEVGVVSDPMDVFFARAEMLDAAVARDDAEDWSRLGAAIRAAKETYLRNRERAPKWTLADDDPLPATDGLVGVPGSPGVAEGPVFLLRGVEDFSRFPPGGILVAQTTNPAWTALFSSAAAVITESGGPLSHGAITAREAGIPAVMAVRGIMSRLTNGTRVRVDGGRGIVIELGGVP